MKRYLVYTTDDSRTRPFDPTRFLASATPQNRRFRPPVEKVRLTSPSLGLEANRSTAERRVYSPNTHSTVAFRCWLSSGAFALRRFPLAGSVPEAIANYDAVDLERHWRRREGGTNIDLPQLIERGRRQDGSIHNEDETAACGKPEKFGYGR